MDIRELRVGNIVNIQEKASIIVNISTEVSFFTLDRIISRDKLKKTKCIDIEPIELNTAFLSLSFKTESIQDEYEMGVNDLIISYIKDEIKGNKCFKIEKRYGENKIFICDIKYWHELQNLYYLLTRKELDYYFRNYLFINANL